MKDYQGLKDQIEQLIDTHTCDVVLEAFAEVCSEKAEHIATNWQDARLAAQWSTISDHLYRLAIEASERLGY